MARIQYRQERPVWCEVNKESLFGANKQLHVTQHGRENSPATGQLNSVSAQLRGGKAVGHTAVRRRLGQAAPHAPAPPAPARAALSRPVPHLSALFPSALVWQDNFSVSAPAGEIQSSCCLAISKPKEADLDTSP